MQGEIETSRALSKLCASAEYQRWFAKNHSRFTLRQDDVVAAAESDDE